ncbi:MAG: MBL fold metallo-hydrolase [Flavobacteriaceae bacterium]|nr:MBL fold metallo-hydrolase [Bacteroidia bacterium]NNK81686.1 MBL fold metallo-hydrolase [Flavobacteriaceae bacterium]
MLYNIKHLAFYFLLATISFSCTEKHRDKIKISPISHATFILEHGNEIIYIDPVGGKIAFDGKKSPTLVLITDIHGDHFNNETLLNLSLQNTPIVLPKAVSEKLDTRLYTNTIVLNNNESHKINESLSIEAIPMYNLREEALKFHPKGRGNGYVLTLGGKRIYISGDTEDIEEMRNLENIDIAFVCMNLPYTMPVKSAANAVLDFKPKKVYPYHYRGKNGLSDVALFKKIVTDANTAIEVVQFNWYK